MEPLADTTALLSASSLDVGYDGKVVVSGVSFEAMAGSVIALIGPNGSGKSTILKTIARQLAPLGGCARVCGAELARMKPAQLAQQMALILTERPQTELLTCRDVIESGRHPYTGRFGTLSTADKEAVTKAMETAHVTDLAENDFMHISDGQRQRVMLARAIAQEPRVLVLDEPTSFLDIRYQVELLRILRHLSRVKGIAVVMSLHEIDLAAKAADTVLCVKDGRIYASGAPEELITRKLVEDVYELEHGTFNELFGSVELGRPHGEPETFVIAGGGTGAITFRKLVRSSQPFYAGVLHKGDVDEQLARDLAAAVVVERAFEPISDTALASAKELLARCKRLIVCPPAFGTLNARNAELVDFARERSIEIQQAAKQS